MIDQDPFYEDVQADADCEEKCFVEVRTIQVSDWLRKGMECFCWFWKGIIDSLRLMRVRPGMLFRMLTEIPASTFKGICFLRVWHLYRSTSLTIPLSGMSSPLHEDRDAFSDEYAMAKQQSQNKLTQRAQILTGQTHPNHVIEMHPHTESYLAKML